MGAFIPPADVTNPRVQIHFRKIASKKISVFFYIFQLENVSIYFEASCNSVVLLSHGTGNKSWDFQSLLLTLVLRIDY
jgi:hypothetical protein